jgi:hypothetical protein
MNDMKFTVGQQVAICDSDYTMPTDPRRGIIQAVNEDDYDVYMLANGEQRVERVSIFDESYIQAARTYTDDKVACMVGYYHLELEG